MSRDLAEAWHLGFVASRTNRATRKVSRRSSPLFVAVAVPVVVLFVLTAHPARLYAEAAVPAVLSCEDPSFAECGDASLGSTCDGGFCQQSSCYEEAGSSRSLVGCRAPRECISAAQGEACDGKALGASCAFASNTGSCQSVACPAPDGAAGTVLGCIVPSSKPAPDPTSTGSSAAPGATSDGSPPRGSPLPSDGGCAVGGASASGATFGLLLALAAFLRRARAK